MVDPTVELSHSDANNGGMINDSDNDTDEVDNEGGGGQNNDVVAPAVVPGGRISGKRSRTQRATISIGNISQLQLSLSLIFYHYY